MKNQTPLGLQGPQPLRGRADVVFVVDASGSMSGVISELKTRLGDFVRGLEADRQVVVDWRVTSLGQDSEVFYLNEFTGDHAGFARGLERIVAGSDEYTLPAIDWAADMPWRDNCHRFIVVLSDEPVESGADPSWQASHLEELMAKLEALHIKLMIFAPASAIFEKMASWSGVNYRTIASGEALLGADLGELLAAVGKTVSTYVGKGMQTPRKQSTPARDIYRIKGKIRESR